MFTMIEYTVGAAIAAVFAYTVADTVGATVAEHFATIHAALALLN